MMTVEISKDTTCMKEEKSMMNEHKMGPAIHGRRHPVPPHERKGMISLQFDEKDWQVFMNVFGNEDDAKAAMGIIHGAPPEIQILAAQLLTLIEKEIEKEAA